MAFGDDLSCYKSKLVMLVIRVTDDECKFSFWYIEVSAYYVYSLVLGAGLHCYKSKLVISARY